MPDDEFGDVIYNVWMLGGNPDEVDRDEVADVIREEQIDDTYLDISRDIVRRQRTGRDG